MLSQSNSKRLLLSRFILTQQFHLVCMFFFVFQLFPPNSLFLLSLDQLQLTKSFLLFPLLLQGFSSLCLFHPPPILFQHLIQLFSFFSSLFLRGHSYSCQNVHKAKMTETSSQQLLAIQKRNKERK
ncbi:hypothetical protein OIU78_018573 [Salix suchowensis]|nr:hypothetical protein OIU78_018573 [Salix suchowensis]